MTKEKGRPAAEMPAQRQENTGKDAVPAGDRQQIEYHMLDAGSQSEIRE